MIKLQRIQKDNLSFSCILRDTSGLFFESVAMETAMMSTPTVLPISNPVAKYCVFFALGNRWILLHGLHQGPERNVTHPLGLQLYRAYYSSVSRDCT
jgi:hypothetical protein